MLGVIMIVHRLYKLKYFDPLSRHLMMEAYGHRCWTIGGRLSITDAGVEGVGGKMDYRRWGIEGAGAWWIIC